jgi:hypothetical protein
MTVAAGKSEVVFFLCSVEEKTMLRQSPKHRGLSMSAFLRQLAFGSKPNRRRKLPRVDPALVLTVLRYGSNFNQVTRWLKTAVRVTTGLVGIERQLVQIAT